MKIAIMGAGGVGGFYGGRLAKAGEDVTFIARGSQLQARRKGGLRPGGAFIGLGRFRFAARLFQRRPHVAADNCVVGFQRESALEAVYRPFRVPEPEDQVCELKVGGCVSGGSFEIAR